MVWAHNKSLRFDNKTLRLAKMILQGTAQVALLCGGGGGGGLAKDPKGRQKKRDEKTTYQNGQD